MSDTPRTDMVTRKYVDSSMEWEEELVPVDVCRTIERELNAANDRIKRLEEAGDAMVETTTTPAADAWHKARGEAKP